jgi:hypothetical protein
VLKIRTEQLEPFRRPLLEEYRRRLATHLRVVLHDRVEALGDSALDDVVWRAIERAWACGIDTERAVASFVECAVCYGEAFGATEDTAWAAEILASELDGDAKMDAIAREEARRVSVPRDAVMRANLERRAMGR